MTERHLADENQQHRTPPSHKRTESIMCLPNDEQRIQIENMVDVVLEDWEMAEEEEEEEATTVPEEETAVPATPPARPFYDWEDEESDDESIPPPATPPEVDWEQRFYMQRNSATAMINILKASMRYMRVDIHKIQDNGQETMTATTAAMRYRLEHMERVVEAYEESDYFTLYRLTPRRLFDIDDENSE